ncbi:DUF4386 domain-containing protein [uncultured Draconibacterium sp.]|uniref:DUF4386 domain-containing protein n=1 Tax=uncultured Draconibacterium sp. TaxID=1573823 RepID=UPI002AA7DFCE|nr:DUF4386 domain-containing protein [uncultured Draconibacterium sp.]
MDITKKIRLSGLLILVGIIAGIFSVAPSIDSIDYLTEASKNSNQIIVATIFQFILSLTYIGFAILIYPIIKNFSTSMSIGFLSFRIMAVSVSVIGIILLLAILALSNSFVQNTAQDPAIFASIGNILKNTRDGINHIFMVLLLCGGNFFLYILFLKAKLVPIWLSIWGVFGIVLSIMSGVLLLFGLVEVITVEYLVLNVPTALFEIVLGFWLLIKGFNLKISFNFKEEL